MKIAALVAALLTPVVAGIAASQTSCVAAPQLVCLSLAEARDLVFTKGLIPPARVMREASQIARAEAIDIQLCRTQGVLVYDVTLLDEDGRVMHKLLGASDGVLMSDRDPAPAVRSQPTDKPGPKPPDQRSLQQRGN